MSYISPDINTLELDFSGIVPTVSTTAAAIAGRFTTGPLNTPVLITSEDQLVQIFGKPNAINYMEWFAAAQFLTYSSSLYVVRAEPSGIMNSTLSGTGFLVDTPDTFAAMTSGNISSTGAFISKNCGISGNSLGVIAVDYNGWSTFKTWAQTLVSVMPNNTTFDKFFANAPGTSLYVQNAAIGAADANSKNDEVHILIYDADGTITGTKYTVLKFYEGLSKAEDAIDYRGQSIYALNAINLQDPYIWMSEFPATSVATSSILDANAGVFASQIAPVGFGFAAFSFTSSGSTYSLNGQLSGGVAGTTPTDTQIINAYSNLANKDLISIGHVITAGFSVPVGQYVATTLAYGRKDTLGYFSPFNGAPGTPIKDSNTSPEAIAVACKQSFNLPEMVSQYTFWDTGYKYIYDKYNRMYRWIPMNGDTAGIAARLGSIAQEWYSPGGFNRGGVNNVIKLAFNPNLAQRDVMYPQGINAIVNFPNQGPTLYGDRTGTTKPSAFDRYNVRRLFIVLEAAISKAAKYELFEFNDAFTQAQFVNMVEPFLRNIQGLRGITDFMVRCDSSNNTKQIIDSNQFVAEIYIKPNRSINTITLTFVATRSDVQFTTLVSH